MQRKGLRATVAGKDTDIPIGAFSSGQYLYFDGSKITTAAGGGGGGGGAATIEPLLCMYCESESEALAMESALGRSIDAMTAYTDETTLTSNTFPFTSQWPSGRTLVLSHSLIPKGGNMASYAAGSFNSTYQTCANNLIPYRNRIAYIRIGWEFNAPNIYAWCAGGDGSNQTPSNYAAAFYNFARILKTTLPEIPISWCPLADNPVADSWYPGDEVVDIIDVDAYMNSSFWSNSFDNSLFSMPNSLVWQEQFAEAHGKMMAWSEWGTDYDTGAWLTAMSQWMNRPRQTRFFSHGYWDSSLGFDSGFATHPTNKAAFVAAFGA